jgi:phage baseplate assembly protein W
MKGPGFYGQNFYIIKDEKELIRENLIRVLLTSPGERPMSDFGCRLKDYLLNQSNVLVQEVQDEIKKAITKWEKRIEVQNVFVELVEEHAARINVVCKIKETFDDFNLDTVIRF